jgi:hypothetical protein
MIEFLLFRMSQFDEDAIRVVSCAFPAREKADSSIAVNALDQLERQLPLYKLHSFVHSLPEQGSFSSLPGDLVLISFDGGVSMMSCSALVSTSRLKAVAR